MAVLGAADGGAGNNSADSEGAFLPPPQAQGKETPRLPQQLSEKIRNIVKAP